MTLLIAIMLAVHMELRWQSYVIIVLVWAFSTLVHSAMYEQACYHGSTRAVSRWLLRKGK
jgi:hypothetical protein